MEFGFWVIVILFLFTISLLVNRYEAKIKFFRSSIEKIRADIEELKDFVEKNRLLIEKNRSNIETISKKQEKEEKEVL
ncbi:hypothetical protein DMB92_05605 [Campylobacter sp. MIT 99-7217]|uniref:hypothetical protein n=1 Tax=Campylobacter sp. MIT 99-7217 TaxID=535091 RepID=UPI0011574904|nr:hypothetical protein [Campylobacter sp. MIT 99-7217]TQR31862.1 hypothetical protein DMB92_05605 [Campylobacter sp. MIT 99-7217]